MDERPVCVDFYCGLGGWAEGFLSEGFRVIGYDIEAHDYGTGGYPGELRIKDVLDITAAEIRELNPRVIVASPPCTEPSYRAMPWKKAKALNAIGPPWKFIELFEACFALSAEADVPLVVENVKGAQPWVGRAKAHFGSYYLWGDVAHCGNRIVAGRPLRMDQTIRAKHTKNNGGSWFAVAHNTGSGHSQNPVNGEKGIPHRPTGHWTNPAENTKVPGLNWSGYGQPGYKAKGFNVTAAQKYRAEQGSKGGGDWYGRDENMSLPRSYGSKSDSRKAASAMIAKIPFPLSSHIARCFK